MMCRGGDMSIFQEVELSEAERLMKIERDGGNVGAGTREIQVRNYIAVKELERKRKEMFDDALSNFRSGKIDEALVTFEEVRGMEPAKYIGDSFERVSRICVVTLYNIACCYSSLKAAEPALEAMEECMKCGFDDYGKVWLPCLDGSNRMSAPCSCFDISEPLRWKGNVPSPLPRHDVMKAHLSGG
jgi:hypothetical protein